MKRPKAKARKRSQDFINGVKSAAEFASEWDHHIAGTDWSFESIILGKLNLIQKRQMKRKRPLPDSRQMLLAILSSHVRAVEAVAEKLGSLDKPRRPARAGR